MYVSRHIQCRLNIETRRFGGLSMWLLFRVLPLILLSGMLVCLAAVPVRASPQIGTGQGDSTEELSSGRMLLFDGQGNSYQAAVQQSSSVNFDISGVIACVTLEQTFRNDSERWLEGVYAFPLPESAAVRAMEIRIGERRIVGRVRERAEAEKIYTEAKAAGKRSSLVEQQRPNLFTNRVANIGPGETIVVRLEYVQQVTYRAGTFSLRFPATITARYMPGPALTDGFGDNESPPLQVDGYLGWAQPTTAVPDANAISPLQYPQPGSDAAPFNPLAVTVRLDSGLPLAGVEAPFHDIVLARRAGVYDIRLANGVTEMDRDFVLNWRPVSGAMPGAALFTEELDGEYFGLLLLLPPADERAPVPPPREIIFVVDTSGSMGGVSIEQARRSVVRALQALRPEDRFNVIEFNSSHRLLYRRPMPATRQHLKTARDFVENLQARGGTEMLPALRAALAPDVDNDLVEEASALRQVIFITDGAVGNEQVLFEEISARLGNTRLFTVGIGSAPNSWFMREAARHGRGSHTFIGNLDQVESKMAVLFEQLSRPAAVDLKLDWPAPVEAWPQRIPDLYLGEPLLVAVRYGNIPPAGELLIEGRVADRPWRQRVQLSAGRDPTVTARHRGVASLWARQKIASLLQQQGSGRSREAVRGDVLPLALKHQLLSPFTSFVAVEQVVARPAAEGVAAVAVPNTRPQGQSPQGFAFPRTATTGPARLWLGLLLLFLATLVWVLRQPELDHAPGRDD